jgi:dienelactone hydrolase
MGSLLLVGAAMSVLLARVRSPLAATIAVLLVVAVSAGSMWLWQRGPAAARAVVGVAAGLLGLAEGAGVLIPRVAAGGPLPSAVAGAACLAAGIVLLVAGVRELLAATRGAWRLLGVAGVVALTAIVLLTLPFAVAATSVPRQAVGATSPADLGLAYRDVAFTAADGVALSGWFLPPRGASGAAPAVVVVHGSGSTRSAVLDQAAALAGRGYAVLLFDARGHGDSDGTAMDFGWYGDADVTGAVTFVSGQDGVDPSSVGVVGMSMGGEEAIGAAAADPRIRTVVAEGATHRVAADKSWQAGTYGIAGTVQGWLDAITYGAADLLTAAAPPPTLRESVAMANPRPVLLITAGQVADEALAADDIRAASPGTVAVWTVPGAGHVGAYARDPGAWTDRVDDFLATALG